MNLISKIFKNLLNRGFIRESFEKQNNDIKDLSARLQSSNETIINLCKSIEGDQKSIIELSMRIQRLEESLGKLNIDIFPSKSFEMFNKVTNSQAGEDSIIFYILMVMGIPLTNCTYLDIGANHAKELSNTYLFYSQGAHGVLVEANPDLIPELKFYRNRDLIINKCVDLVSGEKAKLCVMSGDGLSTPVENDINELIQENPDLKLIKTVEVETITINDIIEQYFVISPTIISIDIEGKDLEILNSINFEKYRPLLVITEMIDYSIKLQVGKKNEKIMEFMQSKGYIEYAFTGINSIFIDKSQLD